ncbi:YjjG family noncanonical pyrimidine nucleotidase [Flavonifractor hominis]|uniref:YjjG family noncanonical pyrimidine nucleotidase n=1 Tax=Flavonifractor hominis TaxID=3133178 RepID=A0ABV1ESQ9_9FIRM
MPRYDFILFDADNTLFDFDRAEHEALLRTLNQHGLPAGPETQALYVSINRGLWARFDRGEVRREWLVVERFAALLRALGCPGDAEALNRDYLTHLGEGAFLLPGAEDLCRALAPHCTLAIVTNGVARAQRGRFDRSPLHGLIPWLFISEEVGASKPSRAFFDPVFHAMGIADRRRALVVGDNLLTDVQGGLDAGADAAWYNPRHLPADPSHVPTWEVADYSALQALILSDPL